MSPWMDTLKMAIQKLITAKHSSAFSSIIGVIFISAFAGIGSNVWMSVKPTTAPVPLTPPNNIPLAVVANAKTKSIPEIPGVTVRPQSQTVAAADPSGPIFFTATKLHHPPALVRGYERFMAGNLVAARSEYESLLKLDPRNTDALHGVAAISLRQGQADTAEEYFKVVLESNPKDELAQAGLIGLKGQADSLRSESRLQTNLVAHPDQPVANIVLGNLYAGQGRWNEAQQAYFNAILSDPDNPDSLFNLAVSHDRLHQPRLALEYYLRALSATDERPFGFEISQIVARLRELRQK